MVLCGNLFHLPDSSRSSWGSSRKLQHIKENKRWWVLDLLRRRKRKVLNHKQIILNSVSVIKTFKLLMRALAGLYLFFIRLFPSENNILVLHISYGSSSRSSENTKWEEKMIIEGGHSQNALHHVRLGEHAWTPPVRTFFLSGKLFPPSSSEIAYLYTTNVKER